MNAVRPFPQSEEVEGTADQFWDLRQALKNLRASDSQFVEQLILRRCIELLRNQHTIDRHVHISSEKYSVKMVQFTEFT